MRIALLALVIAAVGCGGDSPTAPVKPPPSKGGGSGADPFDAGRSDASQGDPLAPQVELLAPAPSSDPDEDEILTDSEVTVKCHAEESRRRGSSDVDPSTVRISAESLVDPMHKVMGVVTSAGAEDFEAALALDDFPNGPVRFSCSVSDTGMPSRTTTAAVDSLLDLGPIVRIVSPKDDSIHALQRAVRVSFEVLPSPLSETDLGAAVSSIDLRVLEQEFEYKEDSNNPGRYTATIPFYDSSIFQMPPSNADILVTAYNSRRPHAVERRAAINVRLDSTGPSITIVSPPVRSIVRGQIHLVVQITDPSGVDKSTIIGRINMGKYELKDWEISGDMYTAQFDTRAPMFADLPDVTIDVTASDMVGNERTVDHQLRLDNVPPIVSIDPPYIREYKVEGDKIICSAPFDPVGPDAASDLDNVERAAVFRAFVNERTNSISGTNALYVAGVDEGSMRLFARHADGIPLLIDTDADGKCDDINNEALSEDDRPVVITLNSMEVRGTAPYVPTEFDLAIHDASGFGCEASGGSYPKVYCNTGMTRTIHQWVRGKPRAIYGLSPNGGEGVACQGNSWTLEPAVGEGWTCLAATVLDKIGNRGVSRPIRVCIDDGMDPPPGCKVDRAANPPPSCVDDCTLPDDLPPNQLLELEP